MWPPVDVLRCAGAAIAFLLSVDCTLVRGTAVNAVFKDMDVLAHTFWSLVSRCIKKSMVTPYCVLIKMCQPIAAQASYAYMCSLSGTDDLSSRKKPGLR
jgi:hypothetical protein